jgi:hypothetical protein
MTRAYRKRWSISASLVARVLALAAKGGDMAGYERKTCAPLGDRRYAVNRPKVAAAKSRSVPPAPPPSLPTVVAPPVPRPRPAMIDLSKAVSSMESLAASWRT